MIAPGKLFADSRDYLINSSSQSLLAPRDLIRGPRSMKPSSSLQSSKPVNRYVCTNAANKQVENTQKFIIK